MNDRAYNMAKLKSQLLKKKYSRESNPYWKLSFEQVEYIERVLGMEVTPAIYNIKTRPFVKINELNHLLRDIHYAYKRGTKRLAKKLNAKERKLLDEYDISYYPLKYEIHLR